MNDFDDFASQCSHDSLNICGEPVEINGKVVPGAFDEFEMNADIERFGTTEQVSTVLVISKKSIHEKPLQKSRVERIKDRSTWLISSVNEDAGHWELMLYAEDKHRSS